MAVDRDGVMTRWKVRVMMEHEGVPWMRMVSQLYSKVHNCFIIRGHLEGPNG